MKTKIWMKFEHHHQQALRNVQKDLCDLHIQTGLLQVSRIQVSLQQASMTVLGTYQTLDLRVIQFPYRTLHAQLEEANVQLSQHKYLGINLVALPIQTLHELHQSIFDELWVREKCVLLVISKFKTNKLQIFQEKAQPWKEKEMFSTHSQNLEVEITQAFNVFPKLNILEKVESTEKIQKFLTVVRKSKDEIN